MSALKREVSWSYRFRMAAVSSGVGAVLWTVLMIIPAPPFSSVQPILVGGGPGTWLLIGYFLYVVAGFCALAGVSALLLPIGKGMREPANGNLLTAGLALYYAGVTTASFLLGLAGYVGGYASTVSHLPEPSIESLLTPYVEPITLGALAACAGALIIMLALGRASTGQT